MPVDSVAFLHESWFETMFYQSVKSGLSLLYTHMVSATAAADFDVAVILLCLLQVGLWKK
jgi:hypothetical protein